MRRYQLSLPGPTECDPFVLQELVRPNLPHYGETWLPIYNEIIHRLQQIYQTQNSIYVIPGSGSCGIDAVFTSLGPKKGLILSNGTFGNRLAAIAGRHLSEIVVLEKETGQRFLAGEIKKILEQDHFDLLAVVHGETSTGMLNHIDPLSEICRKNGLLFIVDAVSTLGGVPLQVDEQEIDFCISASQKSLGALPGLATVSISKKGWMAMPPEDDIHGWYLNLRTWERYRNEWNDWHPYPVTLPLHLLFAFNKALELILQDGLQARWDSHSRISSSVCDQLEQIGIKHFITEKKNRLPTVTAAILPDGFSSEELQHFLQDKYGIMIAGGVGPLRKKIFRIGHMGYSAQPWLVNRVISAIKDFITSYTS